MAFRVLVVQGLSRTATLEKTTSHSCARSFFDRCCANRERCSANRARSCAAATRACKAGLMVLAAGGGGVVVVAAAAAAAAVGAVRSGFAVAAAARTPILV
jgi:hypothetical protein